MTSALLVRLFRTMTLPHWREHRLRTSLTVAGVALGVATVVVVVDIGSSVLASFEHMLTTMAGDMELEITSPAGFVDERGARCDDDGYDACWIALSGTLAATGNGVTRGGGFFFGAPPSAFGQGQWTAVK